jgi:nitrite reductase/ring-hydroxylating ferredoxin subunit
VDAEVTDPSNAAVSRRAVLRGSVAAAAVIGAAGLVAGCAKGSSGSGGVPTTAGATVATSDVPVGGGVVVQSGGGVLVVQPTAGTFAAYSSVCPHQGCTVNPPMGGFITCPCHGSTFRVSDGAVVQGPAQQGLTPLQSHVEGNDVVVS